MRPYVVGVAGGTGSGKTTVARKIVEGGGADVCVLEHDTYYRDRPDLSYEERCQLNFDHPGSLETTLLLEHIRAIKSGETVHAPTYDFKTHRRGDETRLVVPAPILVVEGILLFVEPEIRADRGAIAVPDRPGIGYRPVEDRIEARTVRTRTFTPE